MIGVELAPVGVEGYDRVVLRQLLHRVREGFQDFVGVLRNSLGGRLQQHVDDHVAAVFGDLAAAEHVAKELIFARRAAGEQEDAALAVDDFDIGLALVVAGVLVFGDRLDSQADHAATGGVEGRQLEADRHGGGIGAEGDLLGFFKLRRGVAPLRQAGR